MSNEKLMQQAQQLHDIKKELRAAKKRIKAFESIVKTVDPENLPDCETLAFGQGELLIGYLESYVDDVTCECEGVYLENITKYIEQKNLMELFK
jgi:hypothetical protein